MVCVFGGDGTMLGAARQIAPLGLPLLGVDLGRLGFLTGTSVDDLETTLKEVVAKLEEQFAEGARLEKAIRKNLRGLGYGG